MAKILLDYFFKIIAINPTPAASTAFLKQVCVVVLPVDGYMGTLGVPVLCTTNGQVEAVTDSDEPKDVLSAGLSRVYVMPVADLDLADFLAEEPALNKFFTLLISSDFSDEDITAGTQVISAAVKAEKKVQDILFKAKTAGTAGNSITINYDTGGTADATASVVGSAITVVIEDGVTTAQQIATAIGADSASNALVEALVDSGDEADVQAVFGAAVSLTGGAAAVTDVGDGLDVGEFMGVVGVSSDDDTFLATQAAIENRCAFHIKSENGAKNMMIAFGKLLSNPLDWKNQQYIAMGVADDVNVLGNAEALFDDKISFVISDDEFSHRLALFCAGGKAIVAPYIIRNLEIDLQSKGLQYVSANQPGYTHTQAALLEDELQKVIDGDGLENGNPGYVGRGWITEGDIQISLEQDNFVASARIAVPTPRALWRIAGQITQS